MSTLTSARVLRPVGTAGKLFAFGLDDTLDPRSFALFPRSAKDLQPGMFAGKFGVRKHEIGPAAPDPEPPASERDYGACARAAVDGEEQRGSRRTARVRSSDRSPGRAGRASS